MKAVASRVERIRRSEAAEPRRAVGPHQQARLRGALAPSEPTNPLRATYRLQLNRSFGFAEARALVPYLRELRISHLYLSPCLQARSDSAHGYDVVDPGRISDALGGERELRLLAQAGLPIILDIVPNHMGIGDENRWWRDPEARSRWFDLYPNGGYRRFFDIDDLAAIRQEREEVFEASHAKVLQLLREGVLDGLRIDHPDGLADPRGYLLRLRDRGVQRLWVEKILQPSEPLRSWPVTGTVGYEFLNESCALFVDRRAREPFTQLLAEVTGESRGFQQIALEAQLEQARGAFARDVERLRLAREHQASTLELALASLPVYRTYVNPAAGLVEDADVEAIAAARMPAELAKELLLQVRRQGSDELVTRFQQLSPAIMAKGVEDTAFYRHLRLLCLNEVGGDPERFGLCVESFHEANEERQRRFPEGLLSSQTHDTKRSGDARARLAALSWMPERWREQTLSWRRIGLTLRKGSEAPDRSEEYLLHQTLISVWPISAERLDAHLVKALREAKRNTSWAQPNEDWEQAVLAFTHALLASEELQSELNPFLSEIDRVGKSIALRQLLLKLTSPGVPDIYQGDELWLYSLVDPDNRRPVDWKLRARALRSLAAGGKPTVSTRKLHLIIETLALRQRRASAFAGGYEPIPAGPCTCAYLRGQEVLVIVQVAQGGDGEIEVPLSGRWRDVLSGVERRLDDERRIGALLDSDGLALLERVA